MALGHFNLHIYNSMISMATNQNDASVYNPLCQLTTL